MNTFLNTLTSTDLELFKFIQRQVLDQANKNNQDFHAQMFSVFKDMTTVHLEPDVKDNLASMLGLMREMTSTEGVFSTTMSGFSEDLKSVNATANHMLDKNGKMNIDINHSINFETKRHLIWLGIVCSYLLYLKYPEDTTVKMLFFGLLAYAMYFDSEVISTFLTKMLSFRAQSDDLLDLIIEGSSVFFFGNSIVTKSKGYTDLLEGLGKINSTSEGLSRYLTRLVSWIEKLVYYVASMFGSHIKNSKNQYSDQMDSIDIRLSSLEVVLQARIQRVYSSNECALASSLEKEIHALIQCMSKVKYPHTPADLGLHNLQMRMRPVSSKARRDGGVTGQRIEPYFAMLCGPCGIGKDIYMNFLIKVLMNSILTDEEKADRLLNPTAYDAYVRASGDKYHSGYRSGTKAMYYPDLLQRVSVKGASESQALEMIDLLSKQPMPALSPIAEDKGAVYIAPEFVCATTNYAGSTTATFDELRDAGAFLRRLENSYIMYVKDEFSMDNDAGKFNTSTNNPKYTKRLDVKKFSRHMKETDCKPYAAYLFQAYDLITATPHGPVMEEPAFRAHIVNGLANHKLANLEVQDRFAQVLQDEVYAQADDDDFLYSPEEFMEEAFQDKLGYLQEVHLFFSKFLPYVVSQRDLVKDLSSSAVTYLSGYDCCVRAKRIILKLTSMFSYTVLYSSFGLNDADVWYSLLMPCNISVLLKKFSFNEAAAAIEQCASKFYTSVKPVLDNIDPIFYVLGYNYFVMCASGIVTFTCISMLKKFCAIWGLFQNNFQAQSFVDTDQDSKSMNKVQKNQLYMQLDIIHPNGNSVLVSANYVFFIKGRQCLTVWHSLKKHIDNYSHCKIFMNLYTLANLTREVPCYRVDFSEVNYKFLKTNSDLVILTLPNTIPEFPDMMSRFPSRKLQPLIEKYRGKVSYRFTRNEVHHSVESLADPFHDRSYIAGGNTIDHFTSEVITDPSYRVNVASGIYTTVEFPGACGLTVQTKLLVKDCPHTNQPMITHIHVAGMSMRGFAASVYQEDLRDLISEIPVVASLERLEENISIYKEEKRSMGLTTVDNPILEVVDHDFLNTGQDFIGKRPKFCVKRKSDMVRSIFYQNEAIAELLNIDEKLYPAPLGTVRPLGSTHYEDVSVLAIKPYGRNVAGDLPDKVFYKLANKVSTTLIKQSSPYSIKPLMDFDENFDKIIMGSKDDDYPAHNYSALARNKSVGFTFKDVFDVASRKDIFGDGVMPDPHTPLANALRSITKKLDERLLAGQDICIAVKACPKDELRTRSKVIAGQTRLFSNCDLAVLILQKRYFPDMLYPTKACRIVNEAAVGISPYSDEWRKLYDYITEYSHKVACLDHKGFDTYRTQREFLAFRSFVERFYVSDDRATSVARQTLLNSMFNYTTIVSTSTEERFLSLNSGLCSGYLITSLVGCYINLVTTKISLTSILAMSEEGSKDPRILSDMSDIKLDYYYNKAMSENKIIVYGDDGMLGSLRPDLYNVNDMVKTAEVLLGCILTDECKDTSDENGYVDINDACFIARSFKKIVYEGNIHVVAPLRHKSLYKMLMWNNKQSPFESVVAKVDGFLIESALHGVEFHNNAVRAIHKESFEEYGYISDYENYSQAFEASRNDVFLAFDGDEYVPPMY